MTSGLIISQIARHSLIPKGECRIRELVMLMKVDWEDGLQDKKLVKEEPTANENS